MIIISRVFGHPSCLPCPSSSSTTGLLAARISSRCLTAIKEARGLLDPDFFLHPLHKHGQDVEMYSAAGDMGGLSQALLFAFKESARVLGPEKVQLREILTVRSHPKEPRSSAAHEPHG